MPIKNMGTATMRFNEGIIVSGSSTTSPYGVQLYVSGNLNLDSASEPFIQFQVANEDRAKISVNTSNNLVLHNQYTNKHIVMKVNDQGTTREGIRVDGAVPEVVVNEGSESLVDFRVESNNNTHMLFVDGGNEKVGIGTGSPVSPLHVYGNLDGTYVATIDNDENTNGHVLKLQTDGNGSGSRLLEMEDGDGDVIFRARADGRFGFGPDGVSSMGAGTFVVGIDNSSHTSDIAISKRLQHLGDSDTFIDFEPDIVEVTAGGVAQIKINEASYDYVKINSLHNDVDFLVSSQNNTRFLFKGIAQQGAEKVYLLADSGFESPSDTTFFVSGGIQQDPGHGGHGPQYHTEPGHSVFGGDLMTSGSFEAKMMITAQEGMIFGQNSSSGMGAMFQGYGQVQLNAGNSTTGNELYVMSSSMNATPVMSALPASGTVGIGAYNPQNTLTVSGSVAFSTLYIGSQNDPGSSYYVTPRDHVLLINTNGPGQGGIDSSLDVFLPTAARYPGMVVVIKDAGHNFAQNSVSVKRTGADYVGHFGNTTTSLAENSAYAQFISNGYDTWQLLFMSS